ncbi:MAG TPA: pyridoxamine 5'-phosphate oxidase family protein [Methylibium sp.]|nr:pyridoxamine 5'-phosphate oxidase family protein [Methylibium sp.]
MDDFFHREQRALQDRFDSRALADRVVGVTAHAEVQEPDRLFIESRDMFFLSTVDASGQPSCSYKGGEPGFVKVLDDRTVAFPSYDGNGMYFSMGNIAASAKVGLLFLDFETPHRLRLHGDATLHTDAATLAPWPGAELVVKIAVTALFINCPRYVHRYRRVDGSRYVPDAGGVAPFAKWKRIDAFQDVLPPKDQGRAAASGGEITLDQYFADAQAGQG